MIRIAELEIPGTNDKIKVCDCSTKMKILNHLVKTRNALINVYTVFQDSLYVPIPSTYLSIQLKSLTISTG